MHRDTDLLRKVFDRIDVDSSGFITPQNLHDEMRLEVNLVFLQILHTHSPCPVYSPLYPTRPSSSDPLGPPVTPH